MFKILKRDLNMGIESMTGNTPMKGHTCLR